MSIRFCIPVIPSANLEKSRRFWVNGLGFTVTEEMHQEGRLVMCMLRKGDVWFMLNQRAGTPAKPPDYEGIRLYWTPEDLTALREHLLGMGFTVSELDDREYGQTEFLLTDDDGYSHCFGVPTQP
jgi:uncharacterized glyoxalase superfamily protein PhnB